MNYPIDVVMPSGAVRLGRDVVCDGFVDEAVVRVQTHVHSDHMDRFETSKGRQEIIASEATLRLLVEEYNADIPYRSNIRALKDFEVYSSGNVEVSIVSSGHMLGAVQVITELENGLRLGYSGDFQWPLDHIIQVDALVLDSTYGSPISVREFSQGECEEQFAELVRQLINKGPVHITAHRGTIQRALQIINDEVNCPVIGSQRLSKEIEVYREFGYAMRPLSDYLSDEGRALLKGGCCVRVYGTGDQKPVNIEEGTKIALSAYFTRPDSPIVEYSERSYCVAISNHADFEETIDYVRATNASFVVTDNTRGGKGYELAGAIKQRLSIEARPSSSMASREWGWGPTVGA